MSAIQWFALAAAFIAGGVVTAVVGRRRPRVETDPGPVLPPEHYDDDRTLPMQRLGPYAEQLRREGYRAGQADGLRKLQEATRPPIWQHRSRRRPHHDLYPKGERHAGFHPGREDE